MARKNIKMSAIAPFGIRIPPVLKDELEVEAHTTNRSMNSEINQFIQEGLARRRAARSKLPPSLFKPRPEGAEFDGPYNTDEEVAAIDTIGKDLLEELASGLLRLASRLPGNGGAIEGKLSPVEFYRFAIDELDRIESSDRREVARVFEELMARAASRFHWPDLGAAGPDYDEDEPEELP